VPDPLRALLNRAPGMATWVVFELPVGRVETRARSLPSRERANGAKGSMASTPRPPRLLSLRTPQPLFHSLEKAG
jgi:hypothetical protein